MGIITNSSISKMYTYRCHTVVISKMLMVTDYTGQYQIILPAWEINLKGNRPLILKQFIQPTKIEKKLKMALYGKPTAPPAIWNHIVLPAKWRRWAHTWFTYPRGTDLTLSWPWWRYTCPKTVTHSNSNHLIATQLGVKLTTSRS